MRAQEHYARFSAPDEYQARPSSRICTRIVDGSIPLASWEISRRGPGLLRHSSAPISQAFTYAFHNRLCRLPNTHAHGMHKVRARSRKQIDLDPHHDPGLHIFAFAAGLGAGAEEAQGESAARLLARKRFLSAVARQEETGPTRSALALR
jgi:hypothetical protein